LITYQAIGFGEAAKFINAPEMMDVAVADVPGSVWMSISNRFDVELEAELFNILNMMGLSSVDPAGILKRAVTT
jgi:hypothetical protein